MSSKGYKRFKNRLDYFRTDNEVAEIILLNKELLKGHDTIFNKVDNINHPLLSKRGNNANSRGLVVKHLHRSWLLLAICTECILLPLHTYLL